MEKYFVKFFNNSMLEDVVEISLNARNIVSLKKKLVKTCRSIAEEYTFCQISLKDRYINTIICSDLIEKYE